MVRPIALPTVLAANEAPLPVTLEPRASHIISESPGCHEAPQHWEPRAGRTVLGLMTCVATGAVGVLGDIHGDENTALVAGVLATLGLAAGLAIWLAPSRSNP